MEFDQVCSACHVNLPPNSYFCFNCGKNLKPRPLSTSIPRQIWLYFASIFLAPMGLFYGIKYLGQKGSAKIIGSICILLTVVVLSIVVLASVNLINTINSTMNGTQLNGGTNPEILKQLQDYQKIQDYQNLP